MKKIEAIIRVSKLESVQAAVLACGVEGMTISEVQGVGREKDHAFAYRGIVCDKQYVQRTKVEIITSDEESEGVIDAIYQAAYTGETGDGRILVSSLDEVIRIRTGQSEELRKLSSMR